MNILFLAPYFPYPLDQGGKIRTYNIIKCLSLNNNITLACLSPMKIDDYGPLQQYCEEIICIERKGNIAKDLFVSLFGRYPFNYVRFRSKAFEAALQKLLQKQSFDIVHIELTLLWQYAELFKGIPVILGTQNIEYKVVAQLGRACKNPLKKVLYAIEERKLRTQEQRAWRECSLCLTVSDGERDFIGSYLGTSDKVCPAPNGVDLERFEFRPRANTGKRLLFLGGMDYLPNLDSASYFLHDIFQLIQAQVQDVRLDFVGRELWRIGNMSFSRGVYFHEDVPDVLTWFREADVLVVPLRLGGGTRLKILESMAAGVPIVTTSKGGEGTAAVHNTHLLIADDPEVFAREVVRLLGDDKLRMSLARNARQLVEQKYSWSNIVLNIEHKYHNIPG